MSDGQLAAGTRLYRGSAAPATFDKAGYEAVTWTEIGEVTNIGGDLGAVYSVQSYSTLAQRGLVKRLGQYDNGESPVTYMYQRDDTGQAAIVAAVGSNTPSAFKIAASDSDSTHFYFMALIPGSPVTIGTVDDFIASTVTLAITSESNVLRENAPS